MKIIKKTIEDLMIEQHCLLERLLGKVEENLGKDYKFIIDVFDELKWEFEKHVFIEERAIFKFFNPTKEENYYDVVPNLIKEHNSLLEILNEIEDDLAVKDIKDIAEDVTEFKNLLIKHKEFEEKSFYPDLVNKLDESQKERIIKKIKNSFPSLSNHY
jgi:hemerythrin-like domain-containing protein